MQNKKKGTHSLKILGYTFALLLVFICVTFGYRDIPLAELKETYAPPPSSFLTIDGLRVHYRDEGSHNEDIPIVLIHGTGSSLHTFEAWTQRLKHKQRVLRMDLPGYGLTDPFLDGNYTIEEYSDFIKKFLDKLGVDQCIMGGNSLGGHIAWRFTLKYTENVQKLILIDASGYPSRAKSTPLAFKIAQIPVLKNIFTFITPKFVARQSVENVYHDKHKVTNHLVDRYFELTLKTGNRQAFIDRLSFDNTSEVYQKIPQILQPTLVLWGEQDGLIPVENAHRFHRDLPNDTLVILKYTGHVPMEERPSESLEAVETFLRQ